MHADPAGPVGRVFSSLLATRWLILGLYVLVLPPAAYFAAGVGQDNSIDRLIIATDPDYAATQAFGETFGAGEYAVLLAEADDPFSPNVLQRLDRIERSVGALNGVELSSALSIYRAVKSGFEPTPEQCEAFRAFVTGTDLFKRQGLAGDHFLTMALVLDSNTRERRVQLVHEIDRTVEQAGGKGPPLRALRKVGQPVVTTYLDEATQHSGTRSFGLLAVFITGLVVFLFRSLRTLLAFLLTLGTCLVLTVGFVGVTDGTFTIVSPMVPMTVLVTATATLVYIHSRFVFRPPDRGLHEHQVFALTNKFVPCTASIFAAATGFGALMVSNIRPIREMGLWTAVGLAFTWIVVFTLFPALQSVLKTPTSQERRESAQWFVRLTAWLPLFSYRWRWPLVIGALLLSALGGVSLFGGFGLFEPMPRLDPVEYMNPSSVVYQDTQRARALLPGLSVTNAWLKGDLGVVAEPEVLRGLHEFQQKLQSDPLVGAVVGPTNVLRLVRYVAGQGDGWPNDPEDVEDMAADLETLATETPMFKRVVEQTSLSQTHLTILSQAAEHEDFLKLENRVRELWAESTNQTPALKELELQTVGTAQLQAKVSANLVPTLVESFGLTVLIIFATFLVIFRSGAARLMALIPSIFAILVMFVVMRGTGIMLNVATILIASTVLGTSENDQIHFFYHYLEKRKDGSVEASLRHALLVAGRAIFYATLINASGFFAFVFAELPPMRQFGFLASVALILAMVADFTALPAALWILFRQKPDAR